MSTEILRKPRYDIADPALNDLIHDIKVCSYKSPLTEFLGELCTTVEMDTIKRKLLGEQLDDTARKRLSVVLSSVILHPAIMGSVIGQSCGDDEETKTRLASIGMGWMDDAACKGQASFVKRLPGNNSSNRQAEIDRMSAICGQCPVLKQCADLAKQKNPAKGIWAGRARYQPRKPKKS